MIKYKALITLKLMIIFSNYLTIKLVNITSIQDIFLIYFVLTLSVIVSIIISKKYDNIKAEKYLFLLTLGCNPTVNMIISLILIILVLRRD